MKFQPLTNAASYWSSLFSILAVYFATLAIDQGGARAIAGAVITAIVALSGLSQGLNVANNVQRSALYKPELDKEKKQNAKTRSR
jgi:phosphotransferase system  glucose/maltose/N-acetylglucosamine-specific IIC component